MTPYDVYILCCSSHVSLFSPLLSVEGVSVDLPPHPAMGDACTVELHCSQVQCMPCTPATYTQPVFYSTDGPGEWFIESLSAFLHYQSH